MSEASERVVEPERVAGRSNPVLNETEEKTHRKEIRRRRRGKGRMFLGRSRRGRRRGRRSRVIMGLWISENCRGETTLEIIERGG